MPRFILTARREYLLSTSMPGEDPQAMFIESGDPPTRLKGEYCEAQADAEEALEQRSLLTHKVPRH
jgi:hypothetical protein